MISIHAAQKISYNFPPIILLFTTKILADSFLVVNKNIIVFLHIYENMFLICFFRNFYKVKLSYTNIKTFLFAEIKKYSKFLFYFFEKYVKISKV